MYFIIVSLVTISRFIMAERVEEIVSQILNSSTLRNTLETAVRQATQGSSASPDSNPITSAVPPPLARNVATTTREELRRLFPTIRSTSAADQSNRMIASRTNNTRKRKRAHSPVHSNFCRDVLLLKSPRTILTLKGREKTKAFEQGFAFSKVKFNSGWNREEVNTAFRDLFQSLLADVEFELLIPMSGRLVKPNLPPGGELNGDTIRSIFNHKMIYIRPTVQLTTIDVTDYLACPDVLSDSSHEDVDIANPEANPASSESPNEIQDEHPALSLEQSETTSGTNEGHSESEMTLKSLLQNLNEQITEEGVTMFNIYREGIFDCCLRALKRSSFSPFHKISVNFSDIEGTGEGAVDAGGPSREMFRLVLNHIKESSMFCGSDKKYIRLDMRAMNERHYYAAGQMIALSLIHGGDGPHFFSQSFYSVLRQDIAEGFPTINDIDDHHIRDELNKLSNATDASVIQDIFHHSRV
ncbi:hypothetical protein PPYR_02341 [Photinus pyralis]|uniref:HECT domain-containing protein n=1 Tax=Photinus pyralis TaxID=7054 RepID=A0A5N4B6Y6_PHOPY|nr:hypothetical protein PPYR_02341 [Photinus pyralis]